MVVFGLEERSRHLHSILLATILGNKRFRIAFPPHHHFRLLSHPAKEGELVSHETCYSINLTLRVNSDYSQTFQTHSGVSTSQGSGPSVILHQLVSCTWASVGSITASRQSEFKQTALKSVKLNAGFLFQRGVPFAIKTST